MKQLFVGLTTLSILASACAQNEAKKTDFGPFFSATIRAPAGNTTMKGIVATVGADKNAYVCFDTDLMRASVGWTGDWLKTGNYLREIVHPQPPEIGGTAVFSTKVAPGWIRDGGAVDPRPGKQWNYIYSGNYGSPEVSADEPRKRSHDKVELNSARLSADQKTVLLEMPVKPVMQMKIKFSLKAADGTPVNHEIYNIIHGVRSETVSAK